MVNLFIFLVALAFLIKSANLSIKYTSSLSRSLRISSHAVGFLIVAVISVLPEAAISISSTLQDVPSFGLGTLFGSNVADLTLIIALIIFFGREMNIQKPILKMNFVFIAAIAAPLLMGIDGSYTRIEGLVLILLGVLFFIYILQKGRREISESKYSFSFKSLFSVIISMILLIISAQFTVHYGIALAHDMNLNPTFVGMIFVALGTTLPELFFSIHAVRRHHDGLALGDILGTVVIDAVILVGLMAVIMPFSFPPQIIYVTGLFMILGALLLFFLMRTERMLTKWEAILLVLFYIIYVYAEYGLSLNGN